VVSVHGPLNTLHSADFFYEGPRPFKKLNPIPRKLSIQ
jgi:hypothetical protein